MLLQLAMCCYRKSFEPEQQFSTLCRILTDQTQPMGNKVRLAWLEYLQDLVPLLDSADFKDSMGEWGGLAECVCQRPLLPP